MSDKMNDGGPAFPQVVRDHEGCLGDHKTIGGMSLRDYFAAQALPAAIALVLDDVNRGREWPWLPGDAFRRIVAGAAWGFADAMLAEREKGGAS